MGNGLVSTYQRYIKEYKQENRELFKRIFGNFKEMQKYRCWSREILGRETDNMTGRYDLKGNLILERDNGEIIKITFKEFIQLFGAATDVVPMTFDRDSIWEQLEEALERIGA